MCCNWASDWAAKICCHCRILKFVHEVRCWSEISSFRVEPFYIWPYFEQIEKLYTIHFLLIFLARNEALNKHTFSLTKRQLVILDRILVLEKLLMNYMNNMMTRNKRMHYIYERKGKQIIYITQKAITLDLVRRV